MIHYIYSIPAAGIPGIQYNLRSPAGSPAAGSPGSPERKSSEVLLEVQEVQEVHGSPAWKSIIGSPSPGSLAI
jgi:hypothetical protein